MLSLNDLKWQELDGGYGIAYDASAPLRRMEAGDDVWAELWEELHHQGDVGEASYAVVPQLARIAGSQPQRDWNFYGLVSTIEIERHRKSNPPLPDWLTESYYEAWREILSLALRDINQVEDSLFLRQVLGAVALAKGNLKLGIILSQLDESEIDELLEQFGGGSELNE